MPASREEMAEVGQCKTCHDLETLVEEEQPGFVHSSACIASCTTVDSLVLIQDGAVGLGVESGGSLQSLGTLEGEMSRFEPDPFPPGRSPN